MDRLIGGIMPYSDALPEAVVPPSTTGFQFGPHVDVLQPIIVPHHGASPVAANFHVARDFSIRNIADCSGGR